MYILLFFLGKQTHKIDISCKSENSIFPHFYVYLEQWLQLNFVAISRARLDRPNDFLFVLFSIYGAPLIFWSDISSNAEKISSTHFRFMTFLSLSFFWYLLSFYFFFHLTVTHSLWWRCLKYFSSSLSLWPPFNSTSNTACFSLSLTLLRQYFFLLILHTKKFNYAMWNSFYIFILQTFLLDLDCDQRLTTRYRRWERAGVFIILIFKSCTQERIRANSSWNWFSNQTFGLFKMSSRRAIFKFPPIFSLVLIHNIFFSHKQNVLFFFFNSPKYFSLSYTIQNNRVLRLQKLKAE